MKGNADNSFEVNYRFDYTYDVLAIKVTWPFKYGKTVEMDEDVLFDFDEDNVPVSLEILDASKRLNVPKYGLMNLTDFKMNVSVDDKSICVYANFKVMLHNSKQTPVLESYTNNYSNMPSMETEFNCLWRDENLSYYILSLIRIIIVIIFRQYDSMRKIINSIFSTII